MDFIIWLIVGGIAGWIAGLIVQGSGFGIIGDIVIGILGGFFAGWLLPKAGVPLGTGVIREIIDAVIGAVILILIVKLIRKAI
ncbi:MAG: GlsB/YeaQ/YmgE family stress response membrane protein [Methylovirgula sp.]